MATLTNFSPSNDPESHASSTTKKSKKGGWITFPFIAGGVALMTLGSAGIMMNLIVYMTEEFHIENIEAAQIYNALNGCNNFFPIIAAILADSAFGCFKVVCCSGFISSMAILLVSLTTMIGTLRPPPCHATGSSLLLSSCSPPSKFQLAYLYTTLFISSLAQSGTRFTTVALGANQFHKQGDRLAFFNWFFCAQYASVVLASTVLVYIEDNVSWALGFCISVGSCLISLVIFLLGNRFYIHEKPQGSPFLGLARVVVATIRKWKLSISTNPNDYYYVHDETTKLEGFVKPFPNKSFRCFNRAALKNEGDVKPNGSIAKPWNLCSVQQVEDLKTILKLFPLWSTTMFMSTPIAIQNSMTILQALTLDRHLGPHFKIPAGSIIVLMFLSTSVSLALINYVLHPIWKFLTKRSMTPLRIIGLGHVSCVIAMIISALVESRRLHIVRSKLNPLSNIGISPIIPMSILWLFPQLIFIGICEAFTLPATIGLYYQEFPSSLRASATGIAAVIIGIAYYLSTALVDQIRRTTRWLPHNLNNGRLDKVYWMLTVITTLNFGYYLVCAMFYKYQNSGDGGIESLKPTHVVADADRE